MNRSFYLKTKVLLGFGLVLSAIVLASVIAYNSYEELSRSVDTLSRRDTRLQQIDSIMVMVSKSENRLQEYTIEKSRGKLQSYDSLVSVVLQEVQQLKAESDGNSVKLDSILNLIDAKLVSMNQFMEIRERRDDFRFYDEALRQLEQEASVEENSRQEKEVLQVTPPASVPEDPVPEEKPEAKEEQEQEKGWFKRIIDRLLNNEDKEKNTPPSDSLEIARTEVIPEEDTLLEVEGHTPNLSVDSVRQMLLKLKSEQAATEQYLNQQELDYLANNARVMNRIYELTADVKRERQLEYDRQSEEARNTLQTALSRLGIILLIALCSTILFVYLIFTDIAKSDFLKRQLEQAKEKAEKLARVKEDFLANMSHEIRTPLTAILGFSGLLKNTSLNRQQQTYLSAVDSSSSHLLSLVNDILDFSKIEAGYLKFEAEPFDIHEQVAQLCNNLRMQAEKKDLQLILETEGDALRFVKGDAFRLRQVLYNLVSNAIKFTEEGGIIVRVRLKELNHEYINAQLQVIDTGVGIPSEKQAHIFDAFVQSDVSDTRKYGGTGLGLAISKQIVEAQGGEIALESQVGEGTTFYIALPFLKADEEEIATQAVPTQQQVRFPGLQVLVIDDDPLNTQLLSLTLEKWEVSCLVAQSGPAGLDILKKQHADLVLTDLQMPEMPGEAVAAAVRNQGLDVPIIAFTARVTEDREYFQDKGFQGVLHKPFRDQDVVEMLCQHAQAFAKPVEAPFAADAHASVSEEAEDASWYTLDTIQRFIGDDQQALLSFLENFLKVLGEARQALDQAFRENNRHQMGYYAHKLYPNVSQLGVQELAQLLRKIETIAKSEELAAPSEEDSKRCLSLCRSLETSLSVRLESLKWGVS